MTDTLKDIDETPPKKRSLLRKVLIVGTLTTLLLVGGVTALVAVYFDDIVNAQKDEHLPRVEALLGRKVEVGKISTSLIPLGVEVRDIKVAGLKPGDAPLLELKRVFFSAGVWHAIKSAGTDLQLNAMVIDGLTINLVREKDGSLSYEDVLKRLSEGPPPDEAPKPLDPEVIQRLQQLKLKRIALENSRFRLIDRATGGAEAETQINQLSIEMDDVMLSSPFEIKIGAAVFSDAKNFDLRVKLGPVPIGKPGAPLPIHWIAMKADGIDLSRALPYLPAGTPMSINSAKFKADIRIDDPLQAKGPIRIKGDLSVNQLAVGLMEAGEAFDLKLSPNVVVDQKAGVIDLTGFALSFDDMKITANGRIEGLNAAQPTFKDLTIKTDNLDLGRLTSMLPDLVKSMPKGTELSGIFKLDISASGDPTNQQVKADVNLDEAGIRIPGAFSKPVGTPLNTQFEADRKDKDLDLKSFKLALGPMALTLSGSVRNFDNPTFNIKGDTGRFDINGLVRMLPNVAKAIPPDVKVAGQMRVNISLVGSPKNIDSKVLLELSGANLAVPGTTIKGGGRVVVLAKGDPSSAVSVNIDAALTGLGVRAGEAFSKPAGTPFVIKLAGSRGGQTMNIASLQLNLGPLSVSGSGRVSPSAVDVKVNIGRFSVAQLATMLPALKDSPIAAATLGMNLALSGNPNNPSTIKAGLSDFYFAQGRSSLTGKASVENLDAPKIRFTFSSPNLDLDEMFPPSGEEAPAEEGGGPLPPIVKKIDAAGGMRIAKGVAQEAAFTNFVANLTMKNGVLRFSALDFDAYGGHFSAAPTMVDLGAAQRSFDMNVSFKNVNAQQLLAAQADLPDTLSGRLSTQFKIKGKGNEWETMSKNLTGALGAQLKKGRFHGADLNSAVITPVANAVPGGLVKKPRGVKGTPLSSLAEKFVIANGKATLVEPMVAQTPQGPLELDGYIGLDKALHLKGSLKLSPRTISKISGNKVKTKKPVPVGLTIGGTVDNPKISGVEVGELVKMMGGELLKAAGLEKVMEAKEAALAAKREALAMARQKAAEARRRANAAKKKATALVNKKRKELEAKVRKKKKAAEKKAKAKAKKEAKKRLKGLF